MENRGLALAVVLILGAAMFAGSISEGITGNTLFVDKYPKMSAGKIGMMKGPIGVRGSNFAMASGQGRSSGEKAMPGPSSCQWYKVDTNGWWTPKGNMLIEQDVIANGLISAFGPDACVNPYKPYENYKCYVTSHYKEGKEYLDSSCKKYDASISVKTALQIAK